jgi:hypothetical protein
VQHHLLCCGMYLVSERERIRRRGFISRACSNIPYKLLPSRPSYAQYRGTYVHGSTYCLSNPFLQFIDDVERRVPNPEPSACQSPAILHRKDQFCRRGNAPSSLGPCGASWWDGTGGLGCGFPGAGSTSSTTLCCRCACEVRAVSLGYWHWTVILEFHRSIDRSLVRSRSCVVPAVSQCICG